MTLSTQATLFGLLALTTLVLCQNVVPQDVVSQEENEVKNEVINAADVVCKAFSPDKDGLTKHQPTKRGFFSNLWSDVKGVVLDSAAKNALSSLGKRDPKGWKNVNGTVQEWSRPWSNQWWTNRSGLDEKARDVKDAGTPSGSCEPEYLKQIDKLEHALEVLGTITSLVQSLKQCS